MFTQFIRRSMLFRGLALGLFTLAPLTLPPSFVSLAYAAEIESGNKNCLVPTSILDKVPTEKGTIGVIPYYIKDNQLYLFLGRERIDRGIKQKSGRYSDFGGSLELDGTTLAQNAIRELSEETMGKIVVSEQDLYAKGNILRQVSSKNREVIYIFYPLSEQEYKTTKSLNRAWPALCSNKKESVECEKDQFTWFNAQDISSKATKVRDIEGNYKMVDFRDYFARDCLGHPDFSTMVAHISCRSAAKCVNSPG